MCCSALDKKEQREFMRWIVDNGYVPIRRKGSHIVYRNNEIGHTVAISFRLNKIIMERLKKEIENKLAARNCCTK